MDGHRRYVPVLAGAGRADDFSSVNTTSPPVLLTAPVIVVGEDTVTVPLSGPGDAWEGPKVLRPFLLEPSSGDSRKES